jgi:hypothetical protein
MINDGITGDFQTSVSAHSGSILIDCDMCDLSGTDVCNDCLVTYLCRSEDSSVVVELSEVRALRALGEAGLVPSLKLRKSVECESGR